MEHFLEHDSKESSTVENPNFNQKPFLKKSEFLCVPFLFGKMAGDSGDWFLEDNRVSQGHRENAQKHFWELFLGEWFLGVQENQGFQFPRN